MSEPSLNRPVTVADVAQAAGVGTSTVSRALNGQGRVKEQTRRKVQQTAERLGYVPNPAVASLAALRRTKSHEGTAGRELLPIAILTRLSPNDHDSSAERLSALGQGRGLRFETFNTLEKPFSDAARLGRMLYMRGFAGVVLRHIIVQPEWFADFPWQHFAMLSTDAAFRTVPITIVRASQFEDVLTCWTNLRAKGYSRIGAILPGRENGRLDNLRRLGAWEECQASSTPEDRVPVYTFSVLDDKTLRDIPRWIKEHRPQALLTLLSGTLDKIEPLLEKPLPAAVINGAGKRYPGLDRDRSVEKETVRLMEQLIRASSYGLPPRTIHHAIPADWIEAERP